MRRGIVRCDWCEEIIEIEPLADEDDDHAVADEEELTLRGWILVILPENAEVEHKDYCSRSCLLSDLS